MVKRRTVPFGDFPMEGDVLEVLAYTPDTLGRGYFYAELPDETYGFKNIRVTYPDFKVSENEGFTDNEIDFIVDTLKNNYSLAQKKEILTGYACSGS